MHADKPTGSNLGKSALAVMMAALFLTSIIGFATLYSIGVKKDSLEMELAKAFLQVGVVTVAATALSILVYHYQKRVDQEQRAREAREAQRMALADRQHGERRYLEDTLRQTLGHISGIYNRTKRARRKMRALGILITDGGLRVRTVAYDECMSDVIEAQLDLETIKGDVQTGRRTFPSCETLAAALRMMEEYLGELIEEYETERPHLSADRDELTLSQIPRFSDFIGPTAGSNFLKTYSKSHSDARAAIREDLLGLSGLLIGQTGDALKR